MKYIFLVVEDDFELEADNDIVFRAEKPTLEMLEEEIGRFERHQQTILENYEKDS
jgi:hypothetical protein